MDNVVSARNPIQSSYLTEGAAVLIDKPLEWTSFDVVNKLRYAIRRHLQVKKYKVGHAGTLDPLASGLLILCIGPYTKKIDSIVTQHKGYTGEVTLGVDTPSYDAETLPDTYYPSKDVTHEELIKAQQHFTGDIEQIPPMYSAIKVKGTALYHLARRGEKIARQPRPITIHDLSLVKTGAQTIDITVHCTKGTYIRTLAYDIGQFLETGGYLTALRRTTIGAYSVEDAMTIDSFIEQVDLLKSTST